NAATISARPDEMRGILIQQPARFVPRQIADVASQGAQDILEKRRLRVASVAAGDLFHRLFEGRLWRRLTASFFDLFCWRPTDAGRTRTLMNSSGSFRTSRDRSQSGVSRGNSAGKTVR